MGEVVTMKMVKVEEVLDVAVKMVMITEGGVVLAVETKTVKGEVGDSGRDKITMEKVAVDLVVDGTMMEKVVADLVVDETMMEKVAADLVGEGTEMIIKREVSAEEVEIEKEEMVSWLLLYY